MSQGISMLSVAGVAVLSASVAAIVSLAVTSQKSSVNDAAVEVYAINSQEYSDSDARAFVGGYTVAGHNIVTNIDAADAVSSSVSAFSEPQECICSCEATKHAVHCLGANSGNAFNAIAFLEQGQWIMDQHSINGSVGGFNYHAVFRFGKNPAGGAHSATGYAITTPGAQTTTQFRAEQSAMGCKEGIGAAACLPLCTAYGLRTTQLEDKCGLQPQDATTI